MISSYLKYFGVLDCLKNEVNLPMFCSENFSKSILWSLLRPLNPLNYYHWVILKNNVYVNHPTTILALKTEITNVINSIPLAICQRVIQNFKKRVATCLERNGGHLEHVIKQSGRFFSFVTLPYCYSYICSLVM